MSGASRPGQVSHLAGWVRAWTVGGVELWRVYRCPALADRVTELLTVYAAEDQVAVDSERCVTFSLVSAVFEGGAG